MADDESLHALVESIWAPVRQPRRDGFMKFVAR